MIAVYENSVYNTGKTRVKNGSVVNMAGDFEEISLRDSMQTNSTAPTSPSNYFSDVSSTRSESSRNSSTSVTSAGNLEFSESTEDISRDNFKKDQDENLQPNYHHEVQETQIPRKHFRFTDDAQYKFPSSYEKSLRNIPSATVDNASSNNDLSIGHKPLSRQKSISVLDANYNSYMSKDPLYEQQKLRRASTGNYVRTVSSSESYHDDHSNKGHLKNHHHHHHQPQQRHPNSDNTILHSSGSFQQLPSKNAPLLRKALSTNQLPREIGLGIPTVPLTSSKSKSMPYSQSHGSTDLLSVRMRSGPTSRKLSPQQLEMQYDADEGDDDLSDSIDVLWNVPLSPALYSKSRSHSEANLQQRQKTKKHQHPKNCSNHSFQSSQSSPDLNFSLPCIKESEPVNHYSTTGLEELGQDARDLTRAFQDLSVSSTHDDNHESSADCSNKSKTSNKMLNRRYTDPGIVLDVSKEKAEVLSHTRPSWLPPKSKDEERRHLEQHKLLLEHLAMADKKKEQKRRSQELLRNKQRAQDEEKWKNTVMSHIGDPLALKRALSIPETREMWWRGIPSKYRETIWKTQIGNHLSISEQDYQNLISEAKKLKNSALHNKIKADVDQTFPELQIFGSRNGPLHEDLTNLLLAYSIYRKDIGYQPTLCSMASVFVLNMRAADAFIGFANSLDKSLTMTMILQRDDPIVTSYYTSFLKVLNTKFPTLYRHFQSIRLPPSAYLEPMLSTRFTKHLRIDVINRIWDIMIFEGDGFLLRAALGIISSVEHRLYGSTTEVLEELGWTAPIVDTGCDDDVFIMKVRDALKVN